MDKQNARRKDRPKVDLGVYRSITGIDTKAVHGTLFLYSPTPSTHKSNNRRQYRCLGYASRICTSYRSIMQRSYGTPLIKTRNRLSVGRDEGRVAWVSWSRISSPFSFPFPSFSFSLSLFLPLKFDLRGRLRDSKNRITRRNELGETQPVPRPLLSFPTLTFMPYASILECKTLQRY